MRCACTTDRITYEVTFISSDHFKNSSIIVDLAMGQIPRSTKRVSSFLMQIKLHLSAESENDDDDDNLEGK